MARLPAETLPQLFRLAAERYGERPAFASKDSEGVYQPISYRELYERGVALATALIDLGVEAREHVGLLADNRLEWIIVDYGVLLAGGADVPRGTDITPAEIAYILSHADVKVTFIEHPSMLAKLMQVRDQLPELKTIILMDPKAAAPEGVLKLEDLIAKGRTLRESGDRQVEERTAAVRPDDLFTIIYTSGTTGTPKGVQLTHRNMAFQVRNLPFDLEETDCALSILPVWHSYERVFEMVAISMGLCTYYTSIRTIGDDLKTVQPTMMASAPRLWESLYLKLMARIEKAPPVTRTLFRAARYSTSAVKRAERFFAGQELDLAGRKLGDNVPLGLIHGLSWLTFYIPHRLLDRIVLAKIRNGVGCGRFRGTISGGGALQPHVDEFFNFIGIPVLEGYGLTETAPVLAVRTWKNLVIGTVGPVYPETQVRIVDLQDGRVLYPDESRPDKGRGLRGEIHAKGPQVMKGYYKNPEGTSAVLKDGWLNTGDIGMVTFNDCLKIMGRSKETIVLLNGENVEPVPIESRLVQSPLIDQCMVVGQDQKFLGALIVPSKDGFLNAGATCESDEGRKLLEADIRQLISQTNGFKSFERVADFRYVPKSFEVGQELTATFKLKRHVVTDTYAPLIAEMYPEQR